MVRKRDFPLGEVHIKKKSSKGFHSFSNWVKKCKLHYTCALYHGVLDIKYANLPALMFKSQAECGCALNFVIIPLQANRVGR